MTPDAIRAWLIAEIARTAGLDPSAVDVRAPFDSYGLSSVDALALSGELERLLGRDLPATLVYEHPSIEALSAFLGDAHAGAEPALSSRLQPAGAAAPIAIVGIGCRFPGAADPTAFWRLLRDGVDAIREVPPDRWDAAEYYDRDPSVPAKAVTRWGGFLDQVDCFDPFFFGISPGEAERMDPQQRLLLELAFEAFEDAGCSRRRLAGSRTGVLVGASVNEYGLLQHGRHELLNGHSGTGAALAIAANRISYFFDLHGPSLVVDTACSSSLMAVHLACRSLRAGECDLALAGGVNVILSPAHAIAFTKAGVLAPDGRCKPFDAGADGYVRGEGGGLVVLKPLDRALSDGDAIYAVIRGSAVFQDGRTNGLMAPNREAQEAVLRAAYEDAGIAPGHIQYVEAHGTGTLLGDSMEARALGAVLSTGRVGGPCAVGSVKSNFGHLEAAAGAAGLIKVTLALGHRSLPPSLHFHSPNPHVSFEALGLRVQHELTPWPEHSGPALAAVSSFGFGGTNVHMVLEEAPAGSARVLTGSATDACLVQLSAHSREALSAGAVRLRDFVGSAQASSPSVAELSAATLRRTQLDHRLAVIARSGEELTERLEDFLMGRDHPELVSGVAHPGSRRLAFVFSGQGSQWTGMGRELIRSEPAFRLALERCDEALRPELGCSILERLLHDGAGSDLAGIDLVQPALFAVQVALAELWRTWGLIPDLVVGHSMGEVAAAHLSGGLALTDAARVIAVRSRLLKRLGGQGGMAVVGLSAADTAAWLSGDGSALTIAAMNGPRSSVVAGELDALDTLIETLERQGVFCRRVKVDVAAHGPQAAALAGELRAALQGIGPRPGRVPFVSSVTGSSVDTRELGPGYWSRNLTEPVNFAGAIAEVLREADCDFIEVAPHPLLQSSVQQTLLQLGRAGSALASLRREEGERSVMLQSLAALYASGRDLEPNPMLAPAARPVTLPTYPWQRQRFWLDGRPGGTEPASAGRDSRVSGAHPLLGPRFSLAADSRTHLWQNELDPGVQEFLREHRVHGDLVLPGSAMLEMALAAAKEAGLAETHAIEDVEFSRSVRLRLDAPHTLQVVLAPSEGNALSFAIYGRTDGAEPAEWTRHASATLAPVAPGAQEEQEPTPPATLRARCAEEVRPGALYQAMADRGLEYGPGMRTLVEAWGGDGQALGRVSLPAFLAPEAGSYRIHPGLLDGALQALAAARGLPAWLDSGTTLVPVGCRQVRLLRESCAGFWSYVVLRSASATTGELETDVALLDESGRSVGVLTGLRLARIHWPRRVDPAAADQDLWQYRVQWKSVVPVTAAPAAQSDPAVDRWLILADRHGVGRELARRLEERGQRCRCIECDPTLAADKQGELIAAELSAQRSPLRGVVDLRCTEPAAGCEAVLALVRQMAAAAGTIGAPRLWLVTRGGQPVLTGERVVAAQAPVWGLAKSIAFELPELQCALVDLDPAADGASNSALLASELFGADAEGQIALRGGGRFVSRLVPYQPSACSPRPREFREDRSYLITGGLGGLGLTVARWMVEHGARHLALAGRSPPSPDTARVLDGMRATGAEVVFMAADVARMDQVEALVARIRRTMPALGGVVHAAGVLENGPVLTLDAGQLARVMAPKVDGAWNLHLATRGDDLEFFALFSSAVSVLGSPGQGNYSAANSYLDALAHLRRAEGRPAISINWGPWADVGLVADGSFVGSRPGSGDRGVKGIAPQRGLELLGRALAEEAAQVTILPFELRSLLELYPQAARLPFFAEVGGSETHVARLYARPTLRQEYVAPRNDIERRLADMWRQTLRIDRVGVRDSFFELGGDSVLAAQLVTSVHRAFGVELDLREAFKAFTIEKLATRLEAALVARLEAMSESQVQRLLQEP